MKSKIKRKEFPPDAVIFREGEPGKCAYLIDEGSIEISIFRDGRKIVLAKLGKGGILGEMSLIDDAFRNAKATSLTNSKVIEISKEYFSETLDNADPFVNMLLKATLERFRSERKRSLECNSSTVENVGFQKSTAKEQMLQRFNYEDELWCALEKDEFVLFYQPIISSDEKQIVGFEALSRWQHPEKGLLPPTFMGYVEGRDIAIPFGKRNLEKACSTVKGLSQIKNSNLRDDFFVSINVAPREFAPPSMVGDFIEIMEAAKILPERIKLEVIERTLMEDSNEVQRKLEQLKEYGFTIALDDFGTGYSSLSYLHRFPIDTLKIDRSFVMTMMEEAKSMTIVKVTHGLAHQLDMDVVAEGVETAEQAEILRELGSDYLQGYLYAKPIPLDEISDYIRSYRH